MLPYSWKPHCWDWKQDVFRSPKTRHNCFLRILSLNTLNHFMTLLYCKIGVVSVLSMLFFLPDHPSMFLTSLVIGLNLAHHAATLVGGGLGGLNWILLDRLSIGGGSRVSNEDLLIQFSLDGFTYGYKGLGDWCQKCFWILGNNFSSAKCEHKKPGQVHVEYKFIWRLRTAVFHWVQART